MQSKKFKIAWTQLLILITIVHHKSLHHRFGREAAMGGLIRARSFEGGIRVWSTQPEAPPRIPPSTAPSSSRDPVDVDADSWAGWGREHLTSPWLGAKDVGDPRPSPPPTDFTRR